MQCLPLLYWEPGCRQFECVVDNAVVADCLNGRAEIGAGTTPKASRSTPLLHACADLLARMFQKGWTPRLKILDAVRWRRRVWNNASDLAGRVAVARKQSFTLRDPQFSDLMKSAQWVHVGVLFS